MLLKSLLYTAVDLVFSPLTYVYARFFKAMRKRNFKNLSLSKKIMLRVGVFPIQDHYYEPLFNPGDLKYSLRKDRNLPGIDFNIPEQLDLLKKFRYNEELLKFPMNKAAGKIEFGYDDGPFLSGDSEFLYNMIRHYKPKKFIEIGSGHSTLMARNAIAQNVLDDPAYACDHTCIEPYENKWLEKTDIKILRVMVENADPALFTSLEAGDILFIDSTHMIRPQGDVLYEYLEILPQLKSGVIVHIHDIFTPKDYLTEWVLEQNRFWNEQYLMEAFLSNNKDFRIIGATNFLRHNHYDSFAEKCPVLKKQVESGIEREPGSFWIIRN